MIPLIFWLSAFSWATHAGLLGALQAPWHPWVPYVFWASLLASPSAVGQAYALIREPR